MEHETNSPEQDIRAVHAPNSTDSEAAQRAAERMTTDQLKHRYARARDMVRQMSALLAYLKEFGYEVQAVGEADFEEGVEHFDRKHVAQREASLDREFAGELVALIRFDAIREPEIRREIGKIGKNFVNKVTALQQLSESFEARFESELTPFSHHKTAELIKFEKELQQRLSDISYVASQHGELVAASLDAEAGDAEATEKHVQELYDEAIAPFAAEFEEAKTAFEATSKLAFMKRKQAYAKVEETAEAVEAINARFAGITSLELLHCELPNEQ